MTRRGKTATQADKSRPCMLANLYTWQNDVSFKDGDISGRLFTVNCYWKSTYYNGVRNSVRVVGQDIQ